jgi:hypothetical protein
LPGSLGDFTNGQYYEVVNASSEELKYVFFDKDSLFVYAWADLLNKTGQIKVHDNSGIADVFFHWDISDFDKFADSWTVDVGAGGLTFGDIIFDYDQELEVNKIILIPETQIILFLFNKNCLVQPADWNIHEDNSNDNIPAQFEGQSGLALWFPEDLDYVIQEEAKYVISASFSDVYGKSFSFDNDTISFSKSDTLVWP